MYIQEIEPWRKICKNFLKRFDFIIQNCTNNLKLQSNINIYD